MISHVVPVRLKQSRDRSYEITVRPGIFGQLPRILTDRWPGRKFYIITDTRVAGLYGRLLHRVLAGRVPDVSLIDFPEGEASKNARTAFALQTALLSGGVKRDSLILALGGGVVGDLAGYVAATVLRGIRFIQVPTTLLAQVDSSVGGKVGIDHPVGKNLIGAFHQPSAVFIDPMVLSSLAPEEYRNGLAEVVKIAAALDAGFFTSIERSARAIASRDIRVLSSIIARAVGLKAAVVEKDEFESGLRKSLNLGHTIGHAIEASSHYAIKHGSAVALGMAAESEISVRMGLMTEQDRVRLLRLLQNLGLPTALPPIKRRSQFLQALAADKKSAGSGTRFVLPSMIGSSALGVAVPDQFIADILHGAR